MRWRDCVHVQRSVAVREVDAEGGAPLGGGALLFRWLQLESHAIGPSCGALANRQRRVGGAHGVYWPRHAERPGDFCDPGEDARFSVDGGKRRGSGIWKGCTLLSPVTLINNCTAQALYNVCSEFC